MRSALIQTDGPSKAAKIIAATAAGFSNRQIAALVNCHERYIRLCRQRAKRQDATASLYRLLAQLRQRTLTHELLIERQATELAELRRTLYNKNVAA